MSRKRKKTYNNYAFIDAQNLYLSVINTGWEIDYNKFRRYLKEKYHVKKAYLFIGYLEENEKLYNKLRRNGFSLIFKPTLDYKDSATKGNCDAELVLHTMIHYPHYDRAIIVTGDGDFYCLAEHLEQKRKLEKVLVPNQNMYSALLKRMPTHRLAFIDQLKKKLRLEKNPKMQKHRNSRSKNHSNHKKAQSKWGECRKDQPLKNAPPHDAKILRPFNLEIN